MHLIMFYQQAHAWEKWESEVGKQHWFWGAANTLLHNARQTPQI